jgi:hypothetical protein
LLLGLWGWAGAAQVGAWVVSGSVALVTLGLVWIIPRFPALNPMPMQHLPRSSSPGLDRLYDAIGRAARGIQAVTLTVTRTLEGEAGIMWSLVLLILFISLIAGRVR